MYCICSDDDNAMGVIFTQGNFTRPLQKLLPTGTAAYVGLLMMMMMVIVMVIVIHHAHTLSSVLYHTHHRCCNDIV